MSDWLVGAPTTGQDLRGCAGYRVLARLSRRTDCPDRAFLSYGAHATYVLSGAYVATWLGAGIWIFHTYVVRVPCCIILFIQDTPCIPC